MSFERLSCTYSWELWPVTTTTSYTELPHTIIQTIHLCLDYYSQNFGPLDQNFQNFHHSKIITSYVMGRSKRKRSPGHMGNFSSWTGAFLDPHPAFRCSQYRKSEEGLIRISDESWVMSGQGRQKGRENLNECGYTNHKYAGQIWLIEHVTVAIDGSCALAVSANSECQE